MWMVTPCMPCTWSHKSNALFAFSYSASLSCNQPLTIRGQDGHAHHTLAGNMETPTTAEKQGVGLKQTGIATCTGSCKLLGVMRATLTPNPDTVCNMQHCTLKCNPVCRHDHRANNTRSYCNSKTTVFHNNSACPAVVPAALTCSSRRARSWLLKYAWCSHTAKLGSSCTKGGACAGGRGGGAMLAEGRRRVMACSSTKGRKAASQGSVRDTAMAETTCMHS